MSYMVAGSRQRDNFPGMIAKNASGIAVRINKPQNASIANRLLIIVDDQWTVLILSL